MWLPADLLQELSDSLAMHDVSLILNGMARSRPSTLSKRNLLRRCAAKGAWISSWQEGPACELLSCPSILNVKPGALALSLVTLHGFESYSRSCDSAWLQRFRHCFRAFVQYSA